MAITESAGVYNAVD